MARGIIFIHAPHVFPGNPETLEEWHKALLLPDTFKVVGSKYAPFAPYGQQVLLVESDEIPEPRKETGLTLVNPLYVSVQNEDGVTFTPHFERMEFEV